MSGMIDDFDQDANPARIIKVNKRSFVVGLAWRPIDKVSTAAKEARLLAKEEDMNLMLIYSGLATQAGFASVNSSEIKHYKGAYSLAAVLADRFGEPSWIGVFELDDGNHVLVAVKDGSITPGYDVIGDIGLIRERAIELKHAFKGATVYLPKDESILKNEFSDFTLIDSDLKTVLAGAKLERSHKLGAVSFNLAYLKSKQAIAFIALAFVASGVGVYYMSVYSDHAKQQRADDMARLLQARSLQKERARKEIEEASIKPDWINHPNPMDIVRACEEKIHELPVVLGDWKLEKIDCRATAVVGDYERSKLGMPMSHFESLARQYPIWNAKASAGRVGFKLNAPPKREFSLDLVPDTAWMSEWISFFQMLQQTATAETTIHHKPHPAPPPPKSSWIDLLGKEEAQLPPPWWSTYSWVIKTTAVMPSFLLERLPSKGLVLTKMVAERDSKSGALQWTLEGVANTNLCTGEDTQSC